MLSATLATGNITSVEFIEQEYSISAAAATTFQIGEDGDKDI